MTASAVLAPPPLNDERTAVVEFIRSVQATPRVIACNEGNFPIYLLGAKQFRPRYPGLF